MTGAAGAATLSLVTNTNPQEITGEGENPGITDTTAEILPGQTLYIGIPYSGGAWPTSEATDYFEVSTFLLGVGGDSTASFSFYTATDIGTGSSVITELGGMSAGSTSVLSGNDLLPPSDSYNTGRAGVQAQIEYVNTTGNPFASLSNAIVWLGITNTGANTMAYYWGIPGFGTPSPAYTFCDPFDTSATALQSETYIYNPGGDFETGNSNVPP